MIESMPRVSGNLPGKRQVILRAEAGQRPRLRLRRAIPGAATRHYRDALRAARHNRLPLRPLPPERLADSPLQGARARRCRAAAARRAALRRLAVAVLAQRADSGRQGNRPATALGLSPLARPVQPPPEYGLAVLAERIDAEPDGPVKRALQTTFSDLLRSQNMFCRLRPPAAEACGRVRASRLPGSSHRLRTISVLGARTRSSTSRTSA
jgi:hypothetical protein